MNLKAPRGIVWVVLCLVLALVVFTTPEVAGIVAPRVFAILCLVAMIIAGVAFYRAFKSASSLPSPTGERRRLSEQAVVRAVAGIPLGRGGLPGSLAANHGFHGSLERQL